jgi:DNA-binding IclR family transcriptional regulator
VFDADARLSLGIVSLGPSHSFDADYQSAPARVLRQAANELSLELGYRAHQPTR